MRGVRHCGPSFLPRFTVLCPALGLLFYLIEVVYHHVLSVAVHGPPPRKVEDRDDAFLSLAATVPCPAPVSVLFEIEKALTIGKHEPAECTSSQWRSSSTSIGLGRSTP